MHAIITYPRKDCHTGEELPFTAAEITCNAHAVRQDFCCDGCGSVQAVAAGHVCFRCGRRN